MEKAIALEGLQKSLSALDTGQIFRIFVNMALALFFPLLVIPLILEKL